MKEQACCSGFSSAGSPCLQSTLLKALRACSGPAEKHTLICLVLIQAGVWMGDALKVHLPSLVESQTANWLLSCSTVTTSVRKLPELCAHHGPPVAPPRLTLALIDTLVAIVGCDLSKGLNQHLLISASPVSDSRPTLRGHLRNVCAMEWNSHPNHPPRLASLKPERFRPERLRKPFHMSTLVGRRGEKREELNLCCALTKCQAYGFQMLFHLTLQAAP